MKETLGFASLPRGRFAFIGAIVLERTGLTGGANSIKHCSAHAVKSHLERFGRS